MSSEFEALKGELDKAKGIAKRVYKIVEVGTGWQLPKIKRRGIQIDSGTYFATPELMLDAAIKALEEAKTRKTRLTHPGWYWAPMPKPENLGKTLDTVIVEKLQIENKLNIKIAASASTVTLKSDVEQETDLLITNGIAPSLFNIPLMLLNFSDEVLIMEPDYGPLRVAKMFGKLVRVPLKERKGVRDETRWYFDPHELESRITEKSKLFMFTNPNNPLGYVYSKEDLNAIARIAKKHDLFVFTNECYERHVFSDEFYNTLVFNSLATLPGMMERTFTIQGATKGYEGEGVTQTAWLFGPSKYIGILKWLHFPLAQGHASAVSDYMVAAALTSPFREDYARQQIKVYRQNMTLLWETLNRFSWIECGKAMGGQFVFPDISKCGMDERSFGRFLVEKEIGGGWGMVGTAHGTEYGKNHIRFAYCSPPEYHKWMVNKLEGVLKLYEVLNKDRIKK